MRIKQGQDPVFKDRVLIATPNYPGIRQKSSAGKWLGAVLLAGSLGGAGYYFYPANESSTAKNAEAGTPAPLNLPTAEKAAVKSALVHANKSQPNKTNNAPTTSPQPETAESLISKARGQIAKTRLTSPEGDNAYATYQALNKLDAKQAQLILDEIVAWYVEQSSKLIEKDKIVEAKGVNSAFKQYEKLRELAPQHPSVSKLFDEMRAALKYRIEIQIEAERLLAPKGDNAFTRYQELSSIAAEHADTQQVLKKLVTALLGKEKKQVAKEQVLSPKEDNAFDTTQFLLKLAPDDKEVKDSVNRLAKHLHSRAVHEEKAHNYKESLELVLKALKLTPDDKQLLLLQGRLEAEKVAKKKG